MTIAESTTTDVARQVAQALDAAPHLRRSMPADRRRWLAAAATALEENEPELVEIAHRETHLPLSRLQGELHRTALQLRHLGEVADDGLYLEAIVDHADADYALGPRPDIRRQLVPLGPVAVFSGSNFPFAFSVAGGDTASAIAAGNPVIVKAHSGHPELSARTAAVVSEAFTEASAPDGMLGIVYGRDAGVELVQHPSVKAASFTGSVSAGRFLFDLANARSVPIPFYGELGSLNPVFVTPAAIAERGEQLAREFVTSYTLGTGQFCTKPGLLFLPAGHNLEHALAEATATVAASPMLTTAMVEKFGALLGEHRGVPGVRVIADGGPPSGLDARPTLLIADIATVTEHAEALMEECFGPTSVIVEYENFADAIATARLLGGSLTAAVQGADSDIPELGGVIEELSGLAGRVLWNTWPTGVAVTWAMNHGGPYPAATIDQTSVGATSIRRFLRPVAYQNLPDALLPAALQESNTLGVPRRVDGRLP